MSNNKSLKKLYLAKNLEELRSQADKIQTINQSQFNDLSICNRILKVYDEAMNVLDVETSSNFKIPEEIDQELGYVYLWRFIQLCIKVNQSKIYEKDKLYIESLLSSKKRAKAMKILEQLQKSLKDRYIEIDDLKVENVTLDNPNTTLSPTASKIDDDIQEIIVKKYINSKELVKLIEKTVFKLLIIDCRAKNEFNFAHMDLSYLKKREEATRIEYINLNRDLILPGLVLWNLEEKLKEEKNIEFLDLLKKLSFFDYLILFDSKSIKSDLNLPDNNLLIVKRAFYDFDQSENRCKNEPIIIIGGWYDWTTYYPAYKKKNFSSPSHHLLIKSEEIIQEKQKNNPINDIEYPTIEEEGKKERQKDDEEEKEYKQQPIPSVNRQNKPPMKIDTTPFEIKKTVLQKPAAMFERTNDNLFLNQVYKPSTENIFFVKPVKTSIMNNGIVKYMNPMTGMLDYVYDEGSNIQYTPNDVLPETILREAKKQQPIIPDRKTKKTIVPPSEAPPKPTLKRTFSSPNIEKLVDSDEDNTNKPTNGEVNKNRPLNQNNIPVILNKPQIVAPIVSTVLKPNDEEDKPKPTPTPPPAKPQTVIPPSVPTAPKPNVLPKRGSKPMPENIKRLRLDNLEPQWSNVHPGLTGIRNLGNTCFMNSIIQCLNNTKELKEYFLTDTYRNDLNLKNPLGFGGEIADEFSIICQALWWGHCRTIAPIRFKEIIGQFNSQFLANDQQDAQEFLLFLLDGLHEDLNKIVERPRNLPEINYDNLDDTEGARKAWEHHKKLNNSIIVDLFQGQFRSILACLTCGKQSIKFDAFMYLTLPIPQSRCTLYVRHFFGFLKFSLLLFIDHRIA